MGDESPLRQLAASLLPDCDDGHNGRQKTKHYHLNVTEDDYLRAENDLEVWPLAFFSSSTAFPRLLEA